MRHHASKNCFFFPAQCVKRIAWPAYFAHVAGSGPMHNTGMFALSIAAANLSVCGCFPFLFPAMLSGGEA
jgi:hypothetical protein